MKKGFGFLIALGIVVGSAEAAIVDQVQEQGDNYGTICSEWHFAQTFTAGMSGQLERIDVYITNEWTLPNPPDYPTTVSIVNVVDSEPSGLVLGAVYVEHPTDGFNSINFLAESIFLTAGTMYGIVISNDDPDPFDYPSAHWGIAESDVYSGGSLWNWKSDVGWNQDYLLPDYDFSKMDAAFRTYMVPEPGSIMLLGFGVLALRKSR